jgi:hypothetical protein
MRAIANYSSVSTVVEDWDNVGGDFEHDATA